MHNKGYYGILTPSLGGGLRGHLRSSYAHWKARSGLPISVN